MLDAVFNIKNSYGKRFLFSFFSYFFCALCFFIFILLREVVMDCWVRFFLAGFLCQAFMRLFLINHIVLLEPFIHLRNP